MIVNGKWVKFGDNFDCPKCGNEHRWRGSVLYKGVRYCKPCYRSVTTMIGYYGKHKLEDAVKKVRIVRSYIQKATNNVICTMSLPSCYEGKKVRVVVVEDEE